MQNIKSEKNVFKWLQCILNERFGHQFLITDKDAGYALSLEGHEQGEIYFPNRNGFFLESHSDGPCVIWDAEKEGWTSILEQPLPAPNEAELSVPLIQKNENGYIIHYDILGLTYWMLNRIEEIGRKDLDNHQRFPAINSHAYKNNYLERPIVDEWLHILGQVIQRVWPDIQLTQHQFSMKVSHDVDSPLLYGFKSWKQIIRMMGGHLLKRHDLKAFIQAIPLKLSSKSALGSNDPYNTFSWLMDQSDKNDLISAFYFICGGSHPYDAEYLIEDRRIRNLIREIHERGHEIGLHPSYETFQTPQKIKEEADHLRKVCKEENIIQEAWGGRMHYLRWEHPTTLQAWNDAGMAYDSTLSYADRPGFRCGTCFEYPGFNPLTHQLLDIRIRPLIVMECTVIDQVYLGLEAGGDALNKLIELKLKCQIVKGVFTLLWHNSYLIEENKRSIYNLCLEEA